MKPRFFIDRIRTSRHSGWGKKTGGPHWEYVIYDRAFCHRIVARFPHLSGLRDSQIARNKAERKLAEIEAKHERTG